MTERDLLKQEFLGIKEQERDLRERLQVWALKASPFKPGDVVWVRPSEREQNDSYWVDKFPKPVTVSEVEGACTERLGVYWVLMENVQGKNVATEIWSGNADHFAIHREREI